MKIEELKVFHGLVNYGTQAGLLAKGLRKHGIEAKSYTHADIFDRKTDYQFKSGKSLLGKFFLFKIWYRLVKLYCFFNYDVFHFYFGSTLFRNQWDLPFYRLFGKKVIMEYLGNDIRHYKSLVDRYELPESHDYYKHMEEHDKKVKRRVAYERKYVDYFVSCLPTHVEFAKNYDINVNEIVPLAIDLDTIDYVPSAEKCPDKPIDILHAPTKRQFKGTEYIEKGIEELKNQGYKINFRLVQGIPHHILIKEYEKCDIFIDQISVGWYGTAALEAMAVGRPTCAFIDQRYFKHVGYSDSIPIININKDNIVEKLANLIINRENLPALGVRCREFVKENHDVNKVANNLISIYRKL